MDYIVSKQVKVLVNIEGSLRELAASLQFYSSYLSLVMADRDVRIELSDIDTLQLQGAELRLRMKAQGQSQNFTLLFNSKEDAKELMSHMPLQKEAQESQEFMQNLDFDAKKTPVTTVIIALNIIVFVLMYASEGLNFIQPQNLDVFMKWGSNRIFETVDQPWRLFTCAFIHFGVLHIACNMYFLHAIGRLSEKLLGPRFYIIIYIFAAFMGSLASLLWNADGVISAGASGAVFGVVGMIGAFLLMRRSEVPERTFKSLKNNMLQIVVLNFVFGMSIPGIDNAAHMGGLVGGFIGAALMSRSLDPKKRKAQFIPKLLLGLICLPLICIGIWESGIIQNKPILIFHQVANTLDTEQNDHLKNSDNLVNALMTNVIGQEEFKTEMTHEKEFWNKLLDQISAVEFDQKSRVFSSVTRIKKVCVFQIDYLDTAINHSTNFKEMQVLLKQKEEEWKTLITSPL
ncbi:rhomboid family intramembrane serine protease [Lentisphaera profundi]|uniref:Rhomboid family intramembrane serine protease n=1 Tax=Lentisphaera profundi TaxID=1658616 RepID=A0ABY7VR60_9BACT|nr:rhomboid family intramembrane serine protease [Lentisphaera profundi]WDE96199.1 rhomboid family intramembrane serine protease [Lentisphaera profundi]